MKVLKHFLISFLLLGFLQDASATFTPLEGDDTVKRRRLSSRQKHRSLDVHTRQNLNDKISRPRPNEMDGKKKRRSPAKNKSKENNKNRKRNASHKKTQKNRSDSAEARLGSARSADDSSSEKKDQKPLVRQRRDTLALVGGNSPELTISQVIKSGQQPTTQPVETVNSTSRHLKRTRPFRENPLTRETPRRTSTPHSGDFFKRKSAKDSVSPPVRRHRRSEPMVWLPGDSAQKMDRIQRHTRSEKLKKKNRTFKTKRVQRSQKKVDARAAPEEKTRTQYPKITKGDAPSKIYQGIQPPGRSYLIKLKKKSNRARLEGDPAKIYEGTHHPVATSQMMQSKKRPIIKKEYDGHVYTFVGIP